MRAEGLWADHTVEMPFDHMSLGCEAFALGVDDAAEVYAGDARGDRVPFGLDLEWETDGGAYGTPGTTRYEVPCRVHGEILVGDEVIALDAIGQRDHSWGVRDWWSLGWTWTAGWLEDGTRFHGTSVRIGDVPVPYHPGYVQTTGRAAGRGRAHGVTPDARRPRAADRGRRRGRRPAPRGRAGRVRPGAARGRHRSRVALPRALCRFRDPAGGRRGVGWTEWNQPEADPG